MTTYVKGIPEVIANLKTYQIIKTQAIKDRLKKQAFKIELAAKEMCPVDTNRLRSSISTNWAGSSLSEGKTGGKAKSGDGVKKPAGPKELVYVVGTNVEYSEDVEHGTKKREATPYLFPAFFMYEGETVAALAVIMKKDVRLR